MIEITIPGLGRYAIEHLVLDVNGTIARDGQLIPGILDCLAEVRTRVQVHLVTADTYGTQTQIESSLGLLAVRIAPGHESDQKGRYVRDMGAATVVAIGNGANDMDMLRSAGIGIAILGEEGLAAGALQAADILVRDVLDGLNLLLHPSRIVATLRR